MKYIQQFIKKDVDPNDWDDKIIVLMRIYILIICMHLLIQGVSLLLFQQWMPGIFSLLFFLIHGSIFFLSYVKNRTLIQNTYTAASIVWIVTSVYFLGWDCGTQHFLFPLMIFWLVTSEGRLRYKICFGGALCLLRLVMYLYMQTHAAYYPLGAFPSAILQFINTLFIFIGIIFLVVSFNRETAWREAESSRQELEAAYEQAERANIAKTNFLSRMSHDIRTPINGIVGNVYMLKGQTADPATVDAGLNKIEMLSRQLELLINEVLDMSRIESGKVELTHEVFDLRDKLDELHPSIVTLAEERDVTLPGSHFDMQHRTVVSSPVHIQRILMNILTNGIKYNRLGGSLECWCKEEPIDNRYSNYIFTVKDTGIGMSLEFLEKIFEPFSRAKDTIDTEYTGTGLGMAITKELVDMLDGTISIESHEGVGTTIAVTLPLEVREDVLAPESKEKQNANLEGTRILLVEDNNINMEIATYMLEEEGAIISCALNGQEALTKFADCPQGSYDLILMDIMMPVMNGLEATRQIRALDRADAKRIPIIAMSANAYQEDVQQCLDAGMNAHIAKPIDIETAKQTIAEHLQRRD